MFRIFFSFCFVLLLQINYIFAQNPSIKKIKISTPEYITGTQEIKLQIQALDKNNQLDLKANSSEKININGKSYTVTFENGIAQIPLKITQNTTFEVKFARQKTEVLSVRYIPAWLSLLPPLFAIIMALILREVVVSLFTGIFLGAFILKGFSFQSIIPAILAVADTYILNALNDADHIAVIVFTSAIGGLVAIISKNGGMAGIVQGLSKFANTAKNAQLVTWTLGILIFFDDYANTLIVGNTMRPVTDKFRISREKLAYIVDSTSAPIAAIAFTTTWIGAELGYIKDAAQQIGLNEGAYAIFLSSLEYAYYPIFAVIFMLMLLITQRDFGAMHKAEIRARVTGALNKTTKEAEEGENDIFKEFEPIKNAPLRSINAIIPVALVIFITIFSLFYTGWQSSQEQLIEAGATPAQVDNLWQNLSLLNEGENPSFTRKVGILLGNANSYVALIWSSLLALIVAILMTVSQRIMKLQQTIDTMLVGFRAMLSATLILILAWSLAKVNGDLQTATFITSLLSQGVSPYLLPTITFIFAAFIAFATGSSWGTMAILYPLILPASWAACQAVGMDTASSMEIFYHVTALVLAGAVFGDHCSPISDTTILSSLASGANHIEHVRTQLPYALAVALVSINASLVLSNLGLPFYIIFTVSITLLWLIVRFLGKKLDY